MDNDLKLNIKNTVARGFVVALGSNAKEFKKPAEWLVDELLDLIESYTESKCGEKKEDK